MTPLSRRASCVACRRVAADTLNVSDSSAAASAQRDTLVHMLAQVATRVLRSIVHVLDRSDRSDSILLKST